MKNKKGTSMVSVMVAFILLLIGIAMLSTSIATSINIAKKADNIIKDMESSVSDYYNNPLYKTDGALKNYTLIEVDAKGAPVAGADKTNVFTEVGDNKTPNREDVFILYFFKQRVM